MLGLLLIVATHLPYGDPIALAHRARAELEEALLNRLTKRIRVILNLRPPGVDSC